jgi:hypothetical protein
MTGYPDWNRPAFMEAEEQLLAAGYEVLNPARNKLDDDADWLGYMRLSVHQVADSDGVAVLPNWAASRGAAVETALAAGMGLPVFSVQEWASHLGWVQLGSAA